MSSKLSLKKWSMLFRKIDIAATDTGKNFLQMMQVYDRELVSEQEFKDTKKILEESLKRSNHMQNNEDLKIDRYTCYFYHSTKEKELSEMVIILDSQKDWENVAAEDRTKGFDIIEKFREKFRETFEQANKNIKLIKSEPFEDKKIPHARIKFRLEDKDDERASSKVMSRKKYGNQERSNSKVSSDSAEKNASETRGMGLEEKSNKIKGMGLESRIDKIKREKDRKEKEEKEKKRNRRLFLESKNERDANEERKRTESKNKSNVETQEEPEQDDDLEL